MGCCFSKKYTIMEPKINTNNGQYAYVFDSHHDYDSFNPYIVDQKSVFI